MPNKKEINIKMKKKRKKKLRLNLLTDTPVLKDDPNYYEFYHDYVSPALEKLIRKGSNVHTIGLFGRWGTGKSTIIDNLKQDYKDYPVFIFDAWKYQNDPLRRTFLISLFHFIDDDERVNWKKDKEGKPVIDESTFDDLYVTRGTEKEEKDTCNDVKFRSLPQRIWHCFIENPLPYIILGTLGISLSLWVGAQYKLSESHPVIAFLLQLPGIIGLSTVAMAFVGIVGKEIVDTLTKWVLNDLKGKIKTQTIIEMRQALNSPEQFEKKFELILESIDKELVIVFENIDRI